MLYDSRARSLVVLLCLAFLLVPPCLAQLSAEEKSKPAVVIATLQAQLHSKKVSVAALESTVTRLTEQLEASKKESTAFRLDAQKLSHRVEELEDTAEQLGLQLAHAETAKLSCASSADGDRRKHDQLASDLSRCRAREAHAVATEVNATATATRLAEELHAVQEERNTLARQLHEQRDAASEVQALQHALREKKRHLLALEAVWEKRLVHHVQTHHTGDSSHDATNDAAEEEENPQWKEESDTLQMYAVVSDDEIDAMGIPNIQEMASASAANQQNTFLNVLKRDEQRYREGRGARTQQSSTDDTTAAAGDSTPSPPSVPSPPRPSSSSSSQQSSSNSSASSSSSSISPTADGTAVPSSLEPSPATTTTTTPAASAAVITQNPQTTSSAQEKVIPPATNAETLSPLQAGDKAKERRPEEDSVVHAPSLEKKKTNNVDASVKVKDDSVSQRSTSHSTVNAEQPNNKKQPIQDKTSGKKKSSVSDDSGTVAASNQRKK